ncbi:MAG TPA: hypothetical protein VII98_10720 [Solirubrobacteraceae bacterium]
MRRCLLAMLAALAVFAGAGPARAASPATVSGTLSGAQLPKPADGVALVSAESLTDWSIVGAARVGRGGRYTLKLPTGNYALSSTLVRRGAAAPPQNAFPVHLRAGQRLKQPLTLKRAKKRKRSRAHRSGVNQYGYSYPGTAFAVDQFHGATGELAVLNKGLPSMLMVDLNQYTVYGDLSPGCQLVQVEWEHRQDILDEIALSQTKFVDPTTRLSNRKLIDPELFVRGDIAVSGPASNQTILITARVEDAKTGEVRATTTLSSTAGTFFDDVGKLAPQIAAQLCKPPPEHISVQISATHHRFTPSPVTVTWSGTAVATRDHNTPPGTLQYSITSMNVTDYAYKLVDSLSGCTIHGTFAGATPASGFVELAVDGSGAQSYRMKATLTDLAITVITDGGPKCNGTQEEQVEGYAKSSADGPDRLPTFRPYTTFPISDTSQWTDVNFDGSTTFVMTASAT